MAGLRRVARGGLLCWFALSAAAAAQDYPNRPVRLVVPFPPGGINDIVGRVIAQHLGERLGKQVIVDNRGGAGGVVGSEIRRQRAEGRPHAADRVAGERGQSVALHAALRSGEILRAGRHAGRGAERRHGQSRPAGEQHQGAGRAGQGKPGELQYASSGVGTFLHLAGELFKITADVDILHIPFRGAGPALIDVVGGHTKVAFGSVTSSIGAYPRRQAPRRSASAARRAARRCRMCRP